MTILSSREIPSRELPSKMQLLPILKSPGECSLILVKSKKLKILDSSREEKEHLYKLLLPRKRRSLNKLRDPLSGGETENLKKIAVQAAGELPEELPRRRMKESSKILLDLRDSLIARGLIKARVQELQVPEEAGDLASD